MVTSSAENNPRCSWRLLIIIANNAVPVHRNTSLVATTDRCHGELIHTKIELLSVVGGIIHCVALTNPIAIQHE
jgi:hypothetical protein